LSHECNFLAEFFGENILKIKSVPGQAYPVSQLEKISFEILRNLFDQVLLSRVTGLGEFLPNK
jgi:hypothetical protein